MGDPGDTLLPWQRGTFLGEVYRWDNLEKGLQGPVFMCAHLSALSQAVPRTEREVVT